MKEFLKVELPALETIEKIDESFRQHLFAQWVMNKEKTENFDDLKTKLKSLTKETHIKYKETLDPANFVAINSKIGDLVTEIEYNQTHTARVIIPEALRQVLFKGWEEQGYDFIRLLFHYGAINFSFVFKKHVFIFFRIRFTAKSLDIDPNVYREETKYIFMPPVPVRKPFNGFMYHKWSKLNNNLKKLCQQFDKTF